MTAPVGNLVRSFLEDHLPVQKGLRLASIRSYRDALRLYLGFLAGELHRPITRLRLEDLSMALTLAFLKHLEQDRGNHIRTRNQRLAALRTFFTYVATRAPEMLSVAQQVLAIPIKRTPPPETQYLEREEVVSLLKHVPRQTRNGLRDLTLLLVLYNTGARAQEMADLRIEHIDWIVLRASDSMERATNGVLVLSGPRQPSISGRFFSKSIATPPDPVRYSVPDRGAA